MAIQEGLYKIYYRMKINEGGSWAYTGSFITHLYVGERVKLASGNPFSSSSTHMATLSEIHPLHDTPLTYKYCARKDSGNNYEIGYNRTVTAATTLGLIPDLPTSPIIIDVLDTSTRLYIEYCFYSDFDPDLTWGGWYDKYNGGGRTDYDCQALSAGSGSIVVPYFFWLQYDPSLDKFYRDSIRIETTDYAVCNIGYDGFSSINSLLKESLDGLDPWTEDKLTVTEIPSGSAEATVTTEGTVDTVTISVNEGYVLNSVALYDPTDRLVNRWKELPASGVIQVRRDQPGEWKLRITCQEILSPYNPSTPIEDLPTDTITPTYPTDYIGKYIGAGFYKLFIPTVTQLNAFVNYLYTQTFIDAIMQLWNKMLGIEEMIVGVNIIPGAPTVAGTAIPKVGWVSMTESQAMNYTTQQYIEINLGSLTVSRAWGNYLDFAPYTKISIYLPFIGERTLDTNDVMGKTLNVRYHIDLLSGNCVAYVYVNGSIHYQFSGNCAYSIPISSADTANLFLQPLKAIAGMTLAGVGVATGNPMAVAAGHALGATVGSDESGAFVSPPSAEISAPDVRKVDGLNANTGYMGTIRPYLSIERVKPDINDGFGAETGYQSNKFRTLGNLAGFTKVSEVHLEGITATTAELTQIEAMLKEGVII